MKIIDISPCVDESLPVWPGDPPIRIEQFLDLGRGDAANASMISCSAHTGCHVDAPAHHFADGVGADELSLAILLGPAYVADLALVEQIGPEELDALRLPAGVRRLLFKTRNSNLWNERPHVFHRDYVALTPEGAEWVVRFGVRLVGIDYLSVERFSPPAPITHRTLLQAGVVILEGLDLRAVTPGPYQLICLPLRLRGLDGAPARAVLVDEGAEGPVS